MLTEYQATNKKLFEYPIAIARLLDRRFLVKFFFSSKNSCRAVETGQAS